MSERPIVSTFEEAVAEVRARFKCVPWVSTETPDTFPTGRKYQELKIGCGSDGDGALYLSLEKAAQAWLDEMLRLGHGKTTIYWRIEPEYDSYNKKVWLEEMDLGAQEFRTILVGRPVHRIYSRQDFE